MDLLEEFSLVSKSEQYHTKEKISNSKHSVCVTAKLCIQSIYVHFCSGEICSASIESHRHT